MQSPPPARLQPHCDTFACSQHYPLAPAGPAVTPLARDGAHRIPWSGPGLLFAVGAVAGRRVLAAYSHLLIRTGNQADAALCGQSAANMLLILFLVLIRLEPD